MQIFTKKLSVSHMMEANIILKKLFQKLIVVQELLLQKVVSWNAKVQAYQIVQKMFKFQSQEKIAQLSHLQKIQFKLKFLKEVIKKMMIQIFHLKMEKV